MIGKADGELLTCLTSIGIPPPPINLHCGLTPGKGKKRRETKGRRWTDVEEREEGEMSDRVKEIEGAHDSTSAKTQRSNLVL